MLYGLNLAYKKGRWGCYLSFDEVFYKGAGKTYYKFTLIGLFAVPMSIIAVLYSAILISLKLRKVPREEVIGREQRRDALIQKKVLRMILIVVAAFVLCWLLFFVQRVLSSYNIPVRSCEVLFLRLIFAHLNSALNPSLYFLLNENFREGLKRLLIRCALCRRLISEGNFAQRVSPRVQ